MLRPFAAARRAKRARGLRCFACRAHDDLARGWRIYRIPLSSVLLTLCPSCAEREFGEDER